MVQLRALQVYDRNSSSIDTVVASSDYQPIQARSYGLGSQSKAAVCQSYWNGEYIATGAVIGAVVLGALTLGIGGLLWGAIIGGAIGACADKSAYAMSSKQLASLRSKSPGLARLYSSALAYANKARDLGHKTKSAIAEYVRAQLAKEEGVKPEDLELALAEEYSNCASDLSDERDDESTDDDSGREKSDYDSQSAVAVADENAKEKDSQEEPDDTESQEDDSESE